MSRPVVLTLVLSLVGGAAVHAQSAAPAAQGAPRHSSTATLGATTVIVEHGQPAWNDQRLGQLAQLAQQGGGAWRLGSEGLTTLVVKGGPVFFGEELIQPGRYGFNLMPTGENQYSFVVFEPKNEANAPQMLGDEPNQLVPATFSGDAVEVVAAMSIDFAATGETGTCTLAWGPLRLVAPLSAAAVTTAEIELNGNPAKTTWYRRALVEGTDCTRPRIAGKIDFEIDGSDCSMNVYVMIEGEQLVAVMRNRERETAEAQNKTIEAGMARFDALIQQFGPQAEAQINGMKRQAQRQQIKNELLLEETANCPDNLRFATACEAGRPGILHCEVFQTRRSINLELALGGKKGVIRIDENLFALTGSSP
ncbi:MAG: DUF2911 domain-containing protein [Planctomycetes bacterium]|nr:DUF2911 domain-containing protein [Planctomycetota bacterium]